MFLGDPLSVSNGYTANGSARRDLFSKKSY
jgi:hypothetical protein